MRDQFHANPADVLLPQALAALSDPLRLAIVHLLDANGEMQCGDIYRALNVSKSAASHHFRVLRESGLVRRRHEGNKQTATLRRQEFDAAFPGLLDAVLANFDKTE
ncbi:MAG: metalloregulator ArsR/SmtB family transcription factor [Bifidobacteriaceae bacterium]|jgi:DNA-binding transcriptional ArsR family regulator|nr:metalloregulator ArsR/SmtB family transcription factor [Bifidobacteriaceae bacterium]MCI1914905.1 metalloregulator ArsR/SmtB family transcription factor [Bifidobacteriaceae bacterium]